LKSNKLRRGICSRLVEYDASSTNFFEIPFYIDYFPDSEEPKIKLSNTQIHNKLSPDVDNENNNLVIHFPPNLKYVDFKNKIEFS
jgi:hypothetical protein